MPHYKDTTNKLHFIDDERFAYLLPPGSVLITDEEAAELSVPSLAAIKATKEAEINALRDEKRYNGGVEVDGKWFRSDQAAIAEYTALIPAIKAMGASNSTVVRENWRTMKAGVVAPMSINLVNQILAAGLQKAIAIDDVAETHKAAVRASADPANYDYSTGWPPVFTE